jgi:hypothetical protein
MSRCHGKRMEGMGRISYFLVRHNRVVGIIGTTRVVVCFGGDAFCEEEG